MASPIEQSGQSIGGGGPAPLAAQVPDYPLANRPIHAIYSFVVDAAAQFAYQGYHLAHSLIQHAAATPADIHVQTTPQVSDQTRGLFRTLGCTVHDIQPFGDGRFCNKLAQLDALLDCACDRIVLLDTDTIFVADPRPQLGPDALLAKAVDLANPPLMTLAQIALAARITNMPAPISTDTGDGATYPGNCNGGFYSIPRGHAGTVCTQWRKWADWMRQNIEPLRAAKKADHVDQVAMWLTIHKENIPFRLCRSNLNYFVHLSAPHRYYDPALPICMLHYHDTSLNVLGLISPAAKLHPAAADAVNRANAQIGRHFNNRLFWDLRYQKFPDRGSGVGSLGDNLIRKRQWLSAEGIDSAASVLDVGCGNLEVIKIFNPKNYLGLDPSEQAIAAARRARPDWNFLATQAGQDEAPISAAELVVCFEVLIHQETAEAYHRLIRFLADKTGKKLIVSGYENLDPAAARNHMIFFHEPLSRTLGNTGRFKTIEIIGTHTDVTAFRCLR